MFEAYQELAGDQDHNTTSGGGLGISSVEVVLNLLEWEVL